MVHILGYGEGPILIIGIEGRPGSGKSYYAMEQIYFNLASGKMVFTNMRNIYLAKVAWSLFRNAGIPRERTYKRFRYIDVWEIERLWKEKIENAEIYLDEVMTCWLSRDWSKMDRGLIEWFSQHRKYRVNFTYIAQSIDRVDSTLRDMTQEFITIRNFSYYKLGVFRLPRVFLVQKYAEDRKLALKREWVWPVKKFFGMYDSWALFPTKKVDDGKGNVIDMNTRISMSAYERLSEGDMRESRQDILRRYGYENRQGI